MKEKPKTPEDATIGFHIGNVLEIIAGRYSKAQRMLLEQVQNAIDAHATLISVIINLAKREIRIWDNGEGASNEDMNASLRRLAHSRKTSDKFGRFGIGVVSAFAKCDYFTFTSTKEGDDGYLEWTFNTKDLLDKSDTAKVPCVRRGDLIYCLDHNRALRIEDRGKERVSWKTQVHIVGLTKNARLSNINLPLFRSDIQNHFGKVMMERGIRVKIRFIDEKGREVRVPDVIAEAYSGEQLPPVRIENEEAGKTVFNIYLAREQSSGKYSGVVTVSARGNPFRIAATDVFAKSALNPDILRDLTSGLFEGEIECEKLTLRPERDSYVDDDALFGLCLAVESWHRDVGSKHVRAMEAMRQEGRFHKIGTMALQFVAAMLKLREFEYAREFLKKSEEKKETEREHVNVNKKVIIGVLKPVRPHKPPEEEENGDAKEKKERTKPPVLRSRFGLNFDFAQLTASEVYRFERETATLVFNRSHELWSMCEGTDVALARYQSSVARVVLTLCQWMDMPEEYAVRQEALLDYLRTEVYEIVDGEAFLTKRNVCRKLL